MSGIARVLKNRSWDCPQSGLQSAPHPAPVGTFMASKTQQPSTLPESSTNGRLDSWKEIAAYLKRDERTVRRWEQEGMPVHRHMHKKQASVYAQKAEIDVWWKTGRQRLESPEPEPASKTFRLRLLAGLAAAGVLVVLFFSAN